MAEGGLSNAFHICVHGNLEVTKKSKGSEAVHVISPGEYFGEISMVTGSPTPLQ